jgi:predicted O-methyltransferase YrrM
MSADDEARLGRVEAVIHRLVVDGKAAARLDGKVHDLFPVAVPPAEGETLRRCVTSTGASSTIEVGLGYGISALYLCAGLLDNGHPGHHVVIDPNQATRFGECGLQFLEDADVREMVEYYPEGSETVLPRLLGEGRMFDLGFVDGNHRFDSVFVDLFYLGRMLNPGGIIMVDDYQLAGVARAVAFFVNNLGWVIEEQSPTGDKHEWVVIRTATGSDTRPFQHFADF